MDTIWRSLDEDRRPVRRYRLIHRDVVSVGVTAYLSVQSVWVGVGLLSPLQEPHDGRPFAERSIRQGSYPPFERFTHDSSVPAVDFDETGMLPMVNSLVFSSTSTST